MKAERLYSIIAAPHASEKAAALAERGQYVFRVARDATRAEVKKAVETIFEVEVKGVQVLNVKGKVRAAPGRRPSSRRPGWKKAYVRLAAGQEINLTDLQG